MDRILRHYDPEQVVLLLPPPRDWFPCDHPVCILSDLVDQLDLPASMAVDEQEARGYPPWHRRMVVNSLLVASPVRIPPSRQIAQRSTEDVVRPILTADNTPAFRTMIDFLERHVAALQALFFQLFQCCQKADPAPHGPGGAYVFSIT